MASSVKIPVDAGEPVKVRDPQEALRAMKIMDQTGLRFADKPELLSYTKDHKTPPRMLEALAQKQRQQLAELPASQPLSHQQLTLVQAAAA